MLDMMERISFDLHHIQRGFHLLINVYETYYIIGMLNPLNLMGVLRCRRKIISSPSSRHVAVFCVAVEMDWQLLFCLQWQFNGEELEIYQVLCLGVEKNIKERPTIFIIPVYSYNTRQQCSQSRGLSVKSNQRALNHLNEAYECMFQVRMSAAFSGHHWPARCF